MPPAFPVIVSWCTGAATNEWSSNPPTPPEDGSAWRGLTETYRNLREQTVNAIHDDLLKEFEGLFPRAIDEGTAGRSIASDPSVIFVQQSVDSEARTRLGALGGWLNGFIEKAQFKEQSVANAKEYAQERVGVERGIGFQSGSPQGD